MFLGDIRIDYQAYVSLTNALAVACIVYAIIFVALPIPPHQGLKTYRISLWFLFAAYMATAFIALFDKVMVNMLSMIFQTMSSVLILLISLSLINLIHPERITWKFILVHLAPLVLVNVVYWCLTVGYGNPLLISVDAVFNNFFNPVVFIRLLMWYACVLQLAYFGVMFYREVRLYDARIDDCFAENYKLHLPWVKACFNGAFLIGFYALIINFSSSPIMLMLFYSVLTLFFVIFGTCYIQYPRTYVKIEKMFHNDDASHEARSSKRRYSWISLKKQVVDDKYYTLQGVNIEDMAQYLQIGRTTLSGLINKEEGVNFNVWIGTLRVEEAIRVFNEEPQLSISEVAERLGYSEPSNFSRQFKAITGVSPSEWCRRRK